MGRKQLNTPRSRIKNALRRLWLQSRERAAALKSTGYRCTDCHIKQTKPKDKSKWVTIEVHHTDGINWEGLLDLIAERLLNVPQEPLCKTCHRKRHE